MTQALPEANRCVARVREFFELLEHKDISAWTQLWAEDARIQIPYPPEGFASTIEGKTQIAEAFRGLFANFQSFATQIIRLYPVADSAAVCVEYLVHATLVGGRQYHNENIAIFEFSEDLITVYHDYFDPRRFQEVVNALAQSR